MDIAEELFGVTCKSVRPNSQTQRNPSGSLCALPADHISKALAEDRPSGAIHTGDGWEWTDKASYQFRR